MNYSVIKKVLLELNRWGRLITFKSLLLIVFMSVCNFSSGQPAIGFKGCTGTCSITVSANVPEMTLKNLNPKVGSAIYWEFYDSGVWKPYGGTGYTEYAKQIGDYRAWYKHGSLGTYTVTNILKVADHTSHSSLKTNPLETDLSDNERLEATGLKITESNFATLFPNPCRENLNIVCAANESYSLMVYNEIGVLILSLDQLIGNTVLATDDWEKGVYVILIKEVNSTISISRKVIKM